MSDLTLRHLQNVYLQTSGSIQDAIKAVVEEYEAQSKEMGAIRMKPIRLAPKDGQLVLLMLRRDGSAETAKWDHDKEAWVSTVDGFASNEGEYTHYCHFPTPLVATQDD